MFSNLLLRDLCCEARLLSGTSFIQFQQFHQLNICCSGLPGWVKSYNFGSINQVGSLEALALKFYIPHILERYIFLIDLLREKDCFCLKVNYMRV